MHRLLPRSLLGQVMASVMLALLIAQLVGAFLLYKASRDRLELSALTAVSAQLALGGERPGLFRERPRARERRREGRREDRGEGRPERPPPMPPRLRPPNEIESAPVEPVARLPRFLRYQVEAEPEVALSQDTLEGALAERLGELLEQEGITPHQIAVEVRRAGDDPKLLKFARARPRLSERRGWRDRRLYVASIQRTPDASWETARAFARKPPSGAGWLLIAQTLLIYAILGTILYLVIRRITRPLAQLTERVDDFSRAPDRAVKLAETGPSDTRRLIAAHNKMEARIAALLDEKDVMLGAIGHDLKTPLAALRVRIESVPDEAQRAALAANIEDITCTLDDILSLARIGRANDGADMREAVDVTALADSVVEEFEDLGDPVTLDLPEGRNARIVAQVQVTWLKRALRNLVGNAVRYGEVARVCVMAEGNAVVLRVEDDGPGIPEERIGDMLEPFTRGETSRNRATGGTGLGLTLARAIAEAHEGELVLANRREGGVVVGLNAEIRIPA